MQGLRITARHGVAKKEEQKDEKHIGKLFKKHPKLIYKMNRIQYE